jgi:hypothetical protein
MSSYATNKLIRSQIPRISVQTAVGLKMLHFSGVAFFIIQYLNTCLSQLAESQVSYDFVPKNSVLISESTPVAWEKAR